jgi:hypothetical protein
MNRYLCVLSADTFLNQIQDVGCGLAELLEDTE